MESKFSKIIMLFVIVFSLAACTAKTTETTAVEQETTEKPKSGQKGQKGERPQFADLLTKMDANKDGKLAKAEVKGRLQKDFDKADTNGDGFITEDEFKNMAPPKRGQR